MGSTRAVAECENSGKTKQQRPEVIFHRFPTKDRGLCQAWVTKCKRDQLNPSTSRMCSDHFTPEDYERDLVHELLGRPMRKMLKSGSVPSIFIFRNPAPVNLTLRAQRIEKRQNKEICKGLLHDSQLVCDNGEGDDDSVPQNFKSSQTDGVPRVDELLLQIQVLQKEVTSLKSTLRMKNIEIANLKSINLAHQKAQKKTISEHQPNKLLDNLKGVFSTSQMQRLIQHRRAYWKTEDIVKALTVRSISLKAYRCISSTWGIPLRSLTTLRTWMKGFTCAPGILSQVIEAMKDNATGRGIMTRICGIVFDEMSLDSRVIRDPSLDQVLSHSKAQVLMVRGLCEGWKQPIYFDFDQDMTKEVLLRNVMAFQGAGYEVHSITSDLEGENRSLWKALNISLENTWFNNPANPDLKIHVFSDVPHDMKNLRNHLIDDGVLLSDGTTIDARTLWNMLSHNGKDIKLCPKFSDNLLTLKGSERMKVAPAVQLLSAHASALTKHVYPNSPSIYHFFQTVNDGFDVLNSRIPHDSKNKLKSGYGFEMEAQTNALVKLKTLQKAEEKTEESTIAFSDWIHNLYHLNSKFASRFTKAIWDVIYFNC